jgi:hypothetical protein
MHDKCSNLKYISKSPHLDELSGCADKTPSDKNENFKDQWNRTISFSDIACKKENIREAGTF